MRDIWYIQNNKVYEIMDSFYDWLVIIAEKDFNELKFKSCQDFLDEYQNLIKSLLEKRESIKHDIRYAQFNDDSIRRLKIIIEATAEEYEAISETDKFIDSLLKKQF